MGVFRFISDKLVNLVANLGTDRDKAAGSVYIAPTLTDNELINAYRGSWLPRKIINIPAQDATRKWRSWQADKQQIEKLEALEKRLQLRSKVRSALIQARLLGGAALYIGTADRDTSLPLDPARLGPSGIRYLTVLNRRQLFATELERDPASELFGKARAFRLPGNAMEIHPSRLVIFTGAEVPDTDLMDSSNLGWGDSVLLSLMEAIRQADATTANIASLIFEAKVDVIRIPDFMDGLSDPQYEKRVLERLRLAAMAKGVNGTLVLDKLEEYESKTASFGNLPDLLDRFLQLVCGGADIPATRFMSQSPGGMNATGESDIRNYYDGIQSMQELDIGPAMETLDECLIRSALGGRPEEVHYVWQPLWQPTSKERSENAKRTAETIKTLAETKLFPADALSKAAATVLVEESVLPGLEAALDEYGSELPDEEEEDLLDDPSAAEPPKTPLKDAAPRSLYVSRQVLNADEILAWAKLQGFTSTLPAEALHVTLAYSRQPIDWMSVGSAWGDQNGELLIQPGGARLVEPLGGEGAVVLLFNCSELAWRHMAIREAGASWDHAEYQPHITITYTPGELDLAKVVPYRGRILLGPEVFEELDPTKATPAKED